MATKRMQLFGADHLRRTVPRPLDLPQDVVDDAANSVCRDIAPAAPCTLLMRFLGCTPQVARSEA